MLQYRGPKYVNDRNCLKIAVKKAKQGEPVWIITQRLKLRHLYKNWQHSH